MIGELLGAFGGGAVIVAALFGYLGKTRLEALKSDLAATNTRLSAALSHRNHVTKTQFDLELEIYRGVWKHLVTLRSSTLSLRPVMDQHDPAESDEERMRRRLTSFADAYNEANEAVEANRPFVPDDVYIPLRDLLDTCRFEAIDYQYTSPDKIREYWEKAMKNHEKINQLVESSQGSPQKSPRPVRPTVMQHKNAQ